MTTVDVDHAQANFFDLLDQVANGEEITMIKNGVACAKLVPVPSEERTKRAESIEKIKALSKGLTLDGLSVREMKHEGHKY